MIQKINQKLDKLMPFITPLSVVIGVLLATYFRELAFLIPWIFAFMTFAGALSSNFASMKQAITHPFPILIAFMVLHLLMPVWAWGVGHLVFQGDMLTITGLVLAVVIPTGITSFIWVTMKRGHIALTLAIILIDTFLSPFVVPYSLSLVVGGEVNMDTGSIMKGLLFMIVLPSLLGMIVNELTKGKSKEYLSPWLAPFSKIGLAAVVIINSAVVAPYLQKVDSELVTIGITVFFVAFSGYLFSWGIAKLLKQDLDVTIALIFTGGMRNISAGAVIAVAYFPAAVAVPVVVGMLFQQVLASVFGYFISRKDHSRDVEQRFSA